MQGKELRLYRVGQLRAVHMERPPLGEPKPTFLPASLKIFHGGPP